MEICLPVLPTAGRFRISGLNLTALDYQLHRPGPRPVPRQERTEHSRIDRRDHKRVGPRS